MGSGLGMVSKQLFNILKYGELIPGYIDVTLKKIKALGQFAY